MAKPFPDSVIKAAFNRSKGRCECTRRSCPHSNRCPEKLIWNRRGYEGPGGWEAHHINSNGPATLNNCEILCVKCHKGTRTYGRS